MKKVLMTAFVLMMSFASCAMAAQKVLKVGVETIFAPFEFQDEKGNYTGFDVELVQLMGKTAGYKVEIVGMGFDALIPAVQTHIIDMAAAGMTITEERKKVIDFTDPYYDSGLVIMVPAQCKDIKSYDDLQGKRLGCQIGTTGEMKCRAANAKQVVAFNTQAEAAMELMNGGVDAIINDAPVVEYFLAQGYAKKCKIVGSKMEAEQYGCAIAKDNKDLLDTMNKSLAVMRANGSYDKLYQKWFGGK